MIATVELPIRGPTLLLRAPLSGYLVPLERVPDPVFAQRLVGDGVAIDPVSQSLLAPCDGEVVTLHPANHALTLAVAGGVELLLHIGLDTINLKGRGFTPRVQTGDHVTTGAPLIDFDADFIATHAKSLLSMIVVTNPDRLTSLKPASGFVVEGQDTILDLEVAEGSVEAGLRAGAPITSEAILVANTAGLHARPAAVLANVARKYASDVSVHRGERRANAKSVTSLMSLDVRYGDKVNLVAQGADASQAIEFLADLIRSGLGEEGSPAPAPASRVMADLSRPVPAPRSDDPSVLLGVTASPGLAVGNAYQVRRQQLDVPESADEPESEQRKLAIAIDTARRQLEALQVQLHGQADANKAAIFAAHQEVLDDPDLLERVRSAILKGKSAAFAWQQMIDTASNELAGMHNALLAARAADLRDVGQRVLRALTGVDARTLDVPPDTILIAEDVTPSDMANLDRSKVLGVCTTLGSATSHAAIIARSLDLPAVAGIEPRALDIPDGTPVILDGTRGSLQLNPSVEALARLKARQERRATQKRENLGNASKPAITLDQCHIEVVANIGGLSDAKSAMALGGEGVGLLRTEFLFLDRETAPTEDQQVKVYSEIASALGPSRPLVIRTLDVGGDKPLPYLPIAKEDNPFLGERGLRVGLNRPEVLRTQLRAILRSASLGKLLVMFPMVATLTEWRAAKAMFDEEGSRLGVPPIPLGIMVEIPSAALLAEQFAREADFFSVGTNDLTQYTLAMDRGHPKLAPQVDALHPAVLQLIALAVSGAQQHGRWVGVCGGVASDPQAIAILIGLGVAELSVSVPAIPAVKAQIRSLSMADCRNLAQQALHMETAAQVRALGADPWA